MQYSFQFRGVLEVTLLNLTKVNDDRGETPRGRIAVKRSSHCKSARARSAAAFLVTFGLFVTSVLVAQPLSASSSHAKPTQHGPRGLEPSGARCPWTSYAHDRQRTPAALADEVLARMNLAEKASFVVLTKHPPLQNSNSAIAALCLPALTLSDGPEGLANGLIRVTQFPAAIGVAASFNTELARSTGRAMGLEARAKGIAVIQGVDLNLARVAQSGRTFETFGEDPFLTSVMGVARIEGIQSTGELATAKHFTAYTQETARVRLNQIVSTRALAELYDAPFKAAVQQAQVSSLMCSYGSINGVNDCSDPYLYATLAAWGFQGFVRSDLEAVVNPGQAFRAGLSLIKPSSAHAIMQFVRRGVIPTPDLNRAVRAILVEMFRFNLIASPLRSNLLGFVRTPANAGVALSAAEGSVVLLKNRGSLLPLSKYVGSVAVIGTDALQNPIVTGGGSSIVRDPYVISPYGALRAALGPAVQVTYSPGGPASLVLQNLGDVHIVNGSPLDVMRPIQRTGEPGKADVAIDLAPKVSPAIATATQPAVGDGWTKWGITVRARKAGTYEVSFEQIGDTWVYLNGHPILASPGLHTRSDMATTVTLRAGTLYRISARWFAVRDHRGPQFGIVDVTDRIRAAVDAARHARVAVVMAGDFNMEGVDRNSLNLPGDANALISAVAAVNHHTIVVLNTGGAVLMPWLAHVAGVVEAWYPGQEDGTAIARVLTGAVDPSGRLPITFPASSSVQPTSTLAQFPGVNATVHFSEGLAIGYRWYQTRHVRPLFPFGYGLDYTTFRLGRAVAQKTPTGMRVTLNVTNTGARLGTDVVQAYVHYPAAAGEPPEQLRGFLRVTLSAAATRRVAITVPFSGFQIFQGGAFATLPGRYTIDLGQSSAALVRRVAVTLP